MLPFFLVVTPNLLFLEQTNTYVMPKTGRGEDDPCNFEEYEEEEGWEWNKPGRKEDPYATLFANF